jgi:hypothetical protein
MAKKKIKEFHVGFTATSAIRNIRLPMVAGLLMQNINYSAMAFALTCMWTML